jgi:succinylglutamate desuccinylase
LQIFLFFLLACRVASATIGLGTADIEWSDSGVRGPKYSEILTLEEKLAQAYPELVQVLDYGVTPQNRKLRMMVVMRPGQRKHRPAMLMTGSIHGNEYLNLEDRLPGELLKKSLLRGPVQDYLDSGGAFVFVPIVNPDGYENHDRENSHHVDLNRDWDLKVAGYKGFKEIESEALSSTLENLRKSDNLSYRITVDYHCCAGAVLHPWAYKGDSIAADDLERHRAIAKLAGDRLNISIGATGQILGYYPVGTTKDYYYTRYGALAFTYEGRVNEENRYLSGHLSWWEDMIRSLNAESTHPFVRLALDAMAQAEALFRIAE